MVNPPAVKVLFGFLGAASVGGTTVVGYRIFKQGSKREEVITPPVNEVKKVSIIELLKRDKTRQLLVREGKNGEDADWKKAWSDYKTQNDSTLKNGMDPFKVSNPSPEDPKGNAPEDFLNKCDEASKTEVIDDKDPVYLKVSAWCTKTLSVPRA